MRAFKTLALATCTWLALASVARAEVTVSLRNGRVSIVAKDATVRQILTEYARVGKTTIVNVERVPGGPMTLELKDVSEAEALDVLLRSLSGYMAAPRTALLSADASVFASIVIVPTTASTAVTTTRASAPSNTPAPFAPPFELSQDEQDGPPQPVRPGGAQPVPAGAQPVRPPIFSTFPQPQNGSGGNGAPRPQLPTVVRPGVVPQGAQNNGNDGGLVQPQVIPPPAAPTAAPGQRPASGFGAVSAPGMVAPASQPGQIAPPPQ